MLSSAAGDHLLDAIVESSVVATLKGGRESRGKGGGGGAEINEDSVSKPSIHTYGQGD